MTLSEMDVYWEETKKKGQTWSILQNISNQIIQIRLFLIKKTIFL